MTPQKTRLIQELEQAFMNLDQQWKQDDSLTECFVECGKSAVKYHESLKDSFNLDEIVLGVVKQITNRKEAGKKHPDFALEKDIWKALFKLLYVSLHDLHKARKLLKMETINMNGYKIVRDEENKN